MGWRIIVGLLLLAVSTLGAESTDLKTIEKGVFSGIQEPVRVVVTNQTQWTELWAKHNAQKLPTPPLPEIDFDKQSVIFVGAGRKNTGGYSIEVRDVRKVDDHTEVLVATHEPKPGGLTIQALTAPFHIVKVPRIEGEVKFKPAGEHAERKGG